MRPRIALLPLVLLGACEGCEEQSARETVAVCADAYGEVRSHPQEEWVWNPVKTGDRLASGDWVRTGPESRARIAFEATGSEIEIEPSSTIVIQRPEAREEKKEVLVSISRIKVESGVVRGVVASARASSEVEVATPEGRTIRLEPAEPGRKFGYRVTVNREGVVELAVTEGRAKVRGSDGTSVALDEGQAHDLIGGALVGEPIELPPFPELVSPGVDANVLYRDDLSIDLSWSSVEVATDYRLQVATDQSFNRTVVDQIVAGTRGAFAPEEPGSYYWRVASRAQGGREGEFGFLRRIQATETLQDLLIAPADDQLIKVTRNRPLVEFSWQAVLPPSEYRLVVSRKRRLLRPVFETRTREQKVTTRALSPGTYYWGVYAEGPPERPLFTKPRRLKIRRDVGLTTPDKVTFE